MDVEHDREAARQRSGDCLVDRRPIGPLPLHRQPDEIEARLADDVEVLVDDVAGEVYALHPDDHAPHAPIRAERRCRVEERFRS